MRPSKRSYLPITDSVLIRLAEIARADREVYYQRHADRAKELRHRLMCTALCQGAALHYVDGKNRIKDWDVWSFYRRGLNAEYPYRRRAEYAFEDQRFGLCRVPPEYLGRPVDVLGRSIEKEPSEDFADAIRRYLAAGRTTTVKKLSEKAAVIVEPEERRGEVVWPV